MIFSVCYQHSMDENSRGGNQKRKQVDINSIDSMLNEVVISWNKNDTAWPLHI